MKELNFNKAEVSLQQLNLLEFKDFNRSLNGAILNLKEKILVDIDSFDTLRKFQGK